MELKVPTGGPGDPSFSEAQALVAVGGREARLTLPLGERPRLWSLEDPFLYDATLTLSAGGAEDRVKSYFGLRTIGVERPPGLGHPYVSLNGKPVYLQMTLDQSWNPDGYWNWPTDEAMREEILIARRLGLNTIRTHVKVEVPRKLYWADRLGVLVMADVPNSWGEPDEAMRKEWETALRGMVRRDFNHPSVFSWVLFNEQWGLQTKGADGEGLLAPRDAGVGREVLRPREAARPDAPRRGQLALLRRGPREDGPQLVAHVPARLEVEGARSTRPRRRPSPARPGTTWAAASRASEPMLNSECGNVWGYEGSTGDVDWSFDYHAMMDELRRHPKVAGWLYTEHHDVINEWNGYVRADRSEKETGLGELVPGMTLRDWHAPLYVAVGSYPTTAAKPGETVSVPLWASFLTDASPGPELTLKLELVGHDDLGRFREWWTGERKVPFAPWTSRALEPVAVPMPARRAVAVLRARLEDAAGRVLQRNFTSFVVGEGASPRDETRGRRRAAAPRAAGGPRGPRAPRGGACGRGTRWTGGKQNGAGRRLLRVPPGLAEGPAGGGRDRGVVPRRARGEGALRQGPGRTRARSRGTSCAGRARTTPASTPTPTR